MIEWISERIGGTTTTFPRNGIHIYRHYNVVVKALCIVMSLSVDDDKNGTNREKKQKNQSLSNRREKKEKREERKEKLVESCVFLCNGYVSCCVPAFFFRLFLYVTLREQNHRCIASFSIASWKRHYILFGCCSIAR